VSALLVITEMCLWLTRRISCIDLNLLTIHGKSRFPGLYIWLRDGTRTAVKIPDGCLLVQVPCFDTL
jgi:hypothetical protein